MVSPATVATGCLDLIGPPFWAKASAAHTRKLTANNVGPNRLICIRESIPHTVKMKQRPRQGLRARRPDPSTGLRPPTPTRGKRGRDAPPGRLCKARARYWTVKVAVLLV